MRPGSKSRTRSLLAGLAVVTAVAATLTVGGVPAGAAGGVPRPQDDPFYRVPAGVGSSAPGTVLQSRPVQLAAFAALPQRVQAWQVQYRTTDYRGRPTAGVTTVLRPAGRAPKAVISYQVAEDASAPQCAPSYVLRPGTAPGEVINQAEILLIDAAVAQGFAVSVPDYEGVRGDFGAARQPGYHVLDGLRAAEHFAPLGLPSGAATPAAVWGYSGGSLASGWAAQLQRTYAPELNLRGTAVGGFVTDLSAALLKINGGFGSGLIAAALPGIARTTPAVAAALDTYLTPAGRALLATAAQQCEIAVVGSNAFTDFNRYLTIPLTRLVALPAVATAIAGLDLGTPAPAAPMYVYHAVNDELIPVAGPDAVVPRYCANGTRVRYERDLLSEHGSLAITGGPAALSWLTARLTGTGPAPACSTSTVLSTALTGGGLAGFPTVTTGILLGLLGLPVGPVF